MKFLYVTFLVSEKVSTLLGNTADVFLHTVFSAVRSWLVKPKIGGHLGAAKTAL